MKEEIIILRTKKGTAKNKNHLKEIWKERINDYFPHYELISANIIGDK